MAFFSFKPFCVNYGLTTEHHKNGTRSKGLIDKAIQLLKIKKNIEEAFVYYLLESQKKEK